MNEFEREERVIQTAEISSIERIPRYEHRSVDINLDEWHYRRIDRQLHSRVHC